MHKPKHIMRNLSITISIAAGILLSLPLHASHIIGGEISYECLGNNQWKIKLDVYRDCFYGQAPFDAPAHISVFNDAGVFVNNLNVSPMFTDTIPNNIAGDPCLFPPSDVCVEHAHYEGTVTLTQPNTGYYFVYQRCCRNETIANILDPDQTGATYWVYLSNAARQACNSSPKFKNPPPVFVCVNKPINHPYAATDANGDSLVYSFYTPFEGATFAQPQPPFASAPPYTNDTVVWYPPNLYSLNSLLGPSTVQTLSINSQTGLITGFPEIMGQFVVGVQVKDYKNGQLMSVIRRDFQYNVGVCLEIIPTIDAPPAQCDNLTVQFGNETQVANNFIWYFDWPNTSPSSTQFEPTYTYPDTGTYVIAQVAAPGTQCEAIGFDTIFLQYNSLTANFSFQTYDCTNETVLALTDLSVDNVSPPTQWNWTVTYGGNTLTSTLQNPAFVVPNPSSGTIKLVVRSKNGCEETKILNFTTGGNNPINLLPNNPQICIGSSTQLNPNGPTSGFTYKWGPNVPPAQQNLVNPTVAPLQTTTYNVTVTGFGGLCTSTGQVTVHVLPQVSLAFVADTDCDARVVHFINQSQNAPTGYVWNFGDPTTTNDVSTQANPTYTYPAYGTYTVTLATPPNAVCKDTIQQTITLTEKILEAAFSYAYTNCDEDAVTIKFFDQTNNSLNNTTTRKWTFSGVFNGTSAQQNPTITVTQEGTLNVTLEVTTDEGCKSVTIPAALQIDLTELPGIVDGSQVLGCLNGGVTLNPGGDPDYLYQWSPADGLSCTTCPSPHANPSQTTTYTVVVKNISADTCEISKQMTVLVPQNVGLVASNDVTTCNPQATLTASTTLTPVTYAWFNENNNQLAGNVNSLTVQVSGYRHYIVRATDQQGCHYYDTVAVTGGPANIQAVGDQVKCSDVTVEVSAANLDPNDTLTWQWAPVAAFNGPTNVPNPDYINVTGAQWLTVQATNQFGCKKTDSVYVAIVDVNNNLDFDYVVECSGGTVQFVNQSTNAYNFSWNFGDPTTTNDVSLLDNPTYTYPDTGTYLVALTMDFDLECVDTIWKEVTISDTQFATDFAFEYLGCDADSIEVQFHDATQIFISNIDIVSWHWTTSNGDVSDLPNPIFTVYTGDEFEVTLTIGTSNGCTGSKMRELKLEFTEVNLADTIYLCKGDTTFLNPFGHLGYVYNWMPAAGLSNPNSPNPQVWTTTSQTYTVEITNLIPDTCMLTRTVTVIVPEKIEVESTNDTLTCGAPVTLGASSNISPTTFTWTASPGGFVGSGPSVTVLPPFDTQYKVVGEDQYGCRDSSIINLANETVNITMPGATSACPQNQAQLTVNNGVADHNLTYNWSVSGPGQILPPANGPSVSIVTAPAGQSATYSVVATNQHGCTASLSKTINSFNFVPTVVDSIQVCPGVGEPLNPGANLDLDYAWSPPDGLWPSANVGNPMVTVSQTTIYTVTVSDNFGANQCSKVFQVKAFAPPVIDINETVDTFTCGQPIVISADVNVPVTLVWQNAQGQPIGTGSTLQANPQTVVTYTVVATDSYDCQATDQVVVSNNQLDLLLDGGGVIDTCPMPSYNLCITNLDPSDELIFEWTAASGGTVLSGADMDCAEVTSEQGVDAIFNVTVTNQWGCSSEEQFDVTTFVFDPVFRDIITICPGVATPINPDAAGSSLSYSWSPQMGLSCYDCPNPSATLTANQFYQLTIQGYNGADTCSLVQTVQVRVTPVMNLSTTPADTSICEPVDVTLSASTDSDIITGYIWSGNPDFSNPIGNTPDIMVTPSATSVYYVMATDTLGCRDTAQVTINAYPINISLDDYFNFCVEKAPLTIQVGNNDPAQVLDFDWTPMQYIQEVNPNGSIIVVDIPDTTTFVATVTNQFGCTATDSTTVFYYDIELTIGDMTVSMDTILFNSGEFSELFVDFVPGYTYQWSPEDGLNDPTVNDPIATPSETTVYTVLITDEGGCQTFRSDTVFVNNPDCDHPNIFIPNAFTPNNDGENDVLFVRSNIIDVVEFAIYNRWGQKVFETTDKNTGWDGTYKGERLSPDVYGFYVKATCFNGMEFFKKGNVTLLR
jgi:gliding motility-associated-like protein